MAQNICGESLVAVKKSDKEFTDAKGDLHKHFADGRSEIYLKGPHNPAQQFAEITDAADEAVNRRRFLPMPPSGAVEDTLQVRDDPEESAMPGIDLDGDPGDFDSDMIDHEN